jgi:hypothetical protein
MAYKYLICHFWKSEIFFILGLDITSENRKVICPTDDFVALSSPAGRHSRGFCGITAP